MNPRRKSCPSAGDNNPATTRGMDLGNPPGQGGDVFLQLAGGSEHAADADLNRIQPPLRLRKIAQKSLQFRRNVRFILRGGGVLAPKGKFH